MIKKNTITYPHPRLHSLVRSTEELKKLVAEHPDYPISVLAGEDANPGGEYGWMYCTSIRYEIGEILDCITPVDDDCVFADRDDFEERLADWLCEQTPDADHMSDENWEDLLRKEMEKYEPYWVKAICIYADN